MRLQLSAVLFALSAVGIASAQQGRVYTDADYARAEQFMPYNANPLVLHAVENPAWLSDGRMVYRDTGVTGNTFMLVDPTKGTKVSKSP